MPSAAKLRCNDKFEKVQGKERKGSGRYASALGNPPASAYNPASGTFHMLETVVPESGASIPNGRYRSIDEIHDNNSVGGSAEYDSNSNNGSYSGESDDQLQLAGKDKSSMPRLAPPGLFGGSDKREKIRMKNERKHQRQKERRVKELKDRCIVYLMSRKLEGLTQQLVAMGFPSDRVTMALILNEGDMERSVALLLEGGDGQMKEEQKIEGDANIDISEELARIAEIEFRYKYQRPEIERTIVACEGDIDKAAEILRDRYRNALSPVSPKLKSVQESCAESQAKEQGPANIPVPNRMSSKLSLDINSQKRNGVSGYGTVQVQQPSAGISRLNGEAFASKQTAGSVLEWCKSPCADSQQGLNSKGKVGISLSESSNPSCLPLRQPIISLQQSAVPSRQFTGIVNTASSPSGSNSSIGPPSSTFYAKVSDVFPKAKSPTKTITIPEIFEASGSNQAKQEMPLGRSLLGSTFESQPKSTQVFPSGWTSWDSGLSDISREWNIGHLQNCDYRAIDWSMGMSPSQLPDANLWDLSHGLAASLNFSDIPKQAIKSRDGQGITWNSSLAHDTISTYELWGNPMLKGVPPTCGPLENTANKSSEISALGMQEWTSPFAGKDLITLTNWAVPSPSL